MAYLAQMQQIESQAKPIEAMIEERIFPAQQAKAKWPALDTRATAFARLRAENVKKHAQTPSEHTRNKENRETGNLGKC